MLATHVTKLLGDDVAGVAETLGVIDGFDDALAYGFVRVGDERGAALAALAGALAATPMGDRVAEAVEKVIAGSIADEHVTALAGARTALLGAVHDASLARFDAATGRSRSSWETAAFDATLSQSRVSWESAPANTPANLLAGARSWLRELAITGWGGVDDDVISASTQILQAVLAEPGTRRLAVLLDGLAAELQACSPVSTIDRVPVRRWADLWARALMLSQPGGVVTGDAVDVSGRLLTLGVDVHEHGTAVQFQVHALLEPAGGGPARLVRTSVAASKVDTIVGPAVWKLLQGCPVLLTALAEHRTVELTDVPLLPSGDLVWHDDRARPGEPADPFAAGRVMLGDAIAPAVPPLDRHPARIAEPVLVEGYTTNVDDSTGAVTFDLGGSTLAVAVDRLPSCGPLTREMVAASSACLCLVRWDAGQWTLQPFAVQATVKRKTVMVQTADWALGPTDAKLAKSAAAAGDAVGVLRERAGRLLRR